MEPRSMFSTFLAAAIAVVLLVGMVSPNAAMAGDKIGRKFTGTYWWVEDSSFQRVSTITKDGAFSSVSQAGPFLGFTTGLGSAKRTGKNEITARKIDFDFDSDGTPTGVTRIVFVMTFADKKQGKFQTVSGSLFGETFEPDQNPLDPTEPPTNTFSFTYTGQRVTVD